MNTYDNRLKDVLADRIKDAEMPVPDHLWSGIASRLPEAVVSGSAAAGKAGWGLTQWVVAAVIAGAISTGVYFLNQNNQAPVTPVASEQETIAPENQDGEVNQPEQTASATVERTAPSQPVADSNTSKEKFKTPATPSSQATAPSTASYVSRDTDQSATAQSGAVNATNAGNAAQTNEPAPGNGSTQAPPPVAAAAPLTAAFSARQVDAETLRWLFIPQEDDAKSYVWDFGDGNVSDNMAGAHSYAEEGTFEVTLTVTDKEGNTQKSKQEIHIIKPVVIRPANIFTPNSDSRNDLFEPLHNSSGIAQGLELVIFDQSNRIVFSSETQFTWDGRNPAGDDCPDATYRFYIKALDNHGNPVEKSGLVRLMR